MKHSTFFRKTNSTFVFLLLLFFTFSSLGLTGQTTIEEDVFTKWIGKKYKEVLYETDLGIGNQLTEILSSVGGSNVWDFSTFTYIDSTVIIHEIMEVDGDDPLLNSPFMAGVEYLHAVTLLPGSGGVEDTAMTYQYTSLDDGQWRVHGAFSMVDLDFDGVLDSVVQYFVPASLQVQFPVTMNSMWTDSTNIVSEFAGMELVTATNVDSSWVTGYGRLITPYGDADALRIDRKEVHSNPFFPGTEIDHESDFVIASDEFSANIEIEDERAFYSVRTGEGTSSSIQPVVSGVDLNKVYPNPTVDKAIVEFELLHAQDIEIGIVNTMGQTVQKNIKRDMQAGLNRLALSLENLPVGQYYVRLRSGSQYHITPLFKN